MTKKAQNSKAIALTIAAASLTAALMTALAASSHAASAATMQEKIVLTCGTPDDSLGAVDLIQMGATPIIRVLGYDSRSGDGDGEASDASGTPAQEFTVQTSFKNVLANDSETLIGQKAGSYKSSGMADDAVLFRLLPGQKSARFAMGGKVYTLNCNRVTEF